MTHLTGQLDAIRHKVASLAVRNFTGDVARDNDRLLSLLRSEVLTLDAKYHADIRRRGAADARGDLAACETIELELALLSQDYAALIGDLRGVRDFSHVGLSLKAQVLGHLPAQANEEPCEALLELIHTFSGDVQAIYGEGRPMSGDPSLPSGQPQPGERALAATVVTALEVRRIEMLAHMEEAADADPVAAEGIETRFYASGEHLSARMSMLAVSEASTKADVVALGTVVAILVRNGVGAEGYGFMLPLCRQLCDVVIARGSDLPS
ncbi:MAG: hypothetical protein EON57_00310 [Alphaproteobacteria bacterium]|nr:MAG: hypothetical protein EON57_00310 [Alphaproteobacteria bacterium]